MAINLTSLTEKLKRPKIEAKSIITLFGFLASFVMIFFAIIPDLEHAKNLNKQISQKITETEITSQIIKNFDALRKNIINYDQDIKKLSQITFLDGKLNPIFSYLNGLVEANGLILMDFSIGKKEAESGVINISKQDFSLEVSGSYESLKNFIANLESNIKLIEIKSLSAGLAAAGGKEQKSELLKINLGLNVYVK